MEWQIVVGVCVVFPLSLYIAFRCVDAIVAKLFL